MCTPPMLSGEHQKEVTDLDIVLIASRRESYAARLVNLVDVIGAPLESRKNIFK